MKLDSNYSIEHSSDCWVLTQRVSEARDKEGNRKMDKETGEPLWNTEQSYHANLRQALTAYLNKCLDEATDILDVRNIIADAEARIAKAYPSAVREVK
jgi:hypothetical protein